MKFAADPDVVAETIAAKKREAAAEAPIPVQEPSPAILGLLQQAIGDARAAFENMEGELEVAAFLKETDLGWVAIVDGQRVYAPKAEFRLVLQPRQNRATLRMFPGRGC